MIAGGFGVGKTTAVGAVSEITPLRTEEYLTESSVPVDSLDGVEAKTTTTVAFDFGRLTLPDAPVPLELYLFGAPGQERFLGLWHDLARGAIGAVVLVDTRRLESSFDAISFFEDNDLPFIVANNVFDGAARFHPEQIRAALDLDPHVPVLTCDARNPDHVAGALITLVQHALSSTAPRPFTTFQDAR
ncbi:GTP-binding protein [Streptomyces rubradiris]|uniref:GTP-binding protein n=1 Tax=Streptomyces rubradiris TaxID=285531 RepID=UPI001E58378E|nr:ATP/GTP-binding protein [Streptomyces rubradiris]